MVNTLVFGNSGSGKSTLAKKISAEQNAAHLDLDTVAWQATVPPTRTPISESKAKIGSFIEANGHWVIEGCYADLLALAQGSAEKIIFLDLPVADCIANARNRPWEPHKYESKAAQDANLAMLIDWISQYPTRTDTFSRQAHLNLYEAFTGEKEQRRSNG
ncbi:shikimate kinase [Simiduia curdlanivorans]|uniref:Shikimate kinase n=1 Tax=Simiduia curdlanivorans TaxID=1492769 RepID=A0ABV8V452_9GAMM|nr:shikimate kinase [Simiduia curdlanivorans]MDN3637378.1 shikimate kinase [Simiduia curdlanivorans]